MAHPYYPLTADIPSYAENEMSILILGPFFVIVLLAILFASFVKACRVPLRGIDRGAACWFAMCGFLHIFFEGYYIRYRTQLQSQQTIAAQLWKEYTLSDSRYLTSDPFTVSVETITVFFWGPLSWLTYLAILKSHYARHFLQTILCTAHLYGVALYYYTNYLDYKFTGVSYSRPEFLYYWIYYVGFNFPWVVLPFYFLLDSMDQITQAFKALHHVKEVMWTLKKAEEEKERQKNE